MCQGCNKLDVRNHAHHIWYRGKWNDTQMWDLRVLCKDCHKFIHILTTPSNYKSRMEAERYYFVAINAIRARNGLLLIHKDSEHAFSAGKITNLVAIGAIESRIKYSEMKGLKEAALPISIRKRFSNNPTRPKKHHDPKNETLCQLCGSAPHISTVRLPHQIKECKLCSDCCKYLTVVGTPSFFKYAREKRKLSKPALAWTV